MTPFSLARPARSSLVGRLDRLRASLEDLGERLREGVAQAVSGSLGDAVRDALRSLLGIGDVGHMCYAAERPYQPAPLWGGSDGPDHTRWADDRDHTRWSGSSLPHEDDHADEDDAPEATPNSESPGRLRWCQAVAVGLQASAWWLRRCTGRFTLLSAVGVGVASALVAYVGGHLAIAAAGLAGSALTLLALTDALP
jgi:hypothetical protein